MPSFALPRRCFRRAKLGIVEQVSPFPTLSHSVEEFQMQNGNQMKLPSRSAGRFLEGLVLLGLAPATLLNALTLRFAGSPLLRMPCLITLATGHACPGCGLTRALSLLWLGQLRSAVALNPLSPVVFSLLILLFCLQVRRLLISQREPLIIPK